MKKQNEKWAPQEPDDRPSSGRQQRHLGRVVHDDRGSATFEWRAAPANHVRPKLELEPSGPSGREDVKLRRGLEPTLELCNDDTYDPYDRKGNTFSGRYTAPGQPRGGKRDLRKLSEWIKTMRALEERKKNGSGS